MSKFEGGYEYTSPDEDRIVERALRATVQPSAVPLREWCRHWPDGANNRCGALAEFILWGKFFPPEALGPRCHDHALPYSRLDTHTVEQSAIYDLRPTNRAYEQMGDLAVAATAKGPFDV